MAVVKEDIKQALLKMTEELKDMTDSEESLEKWSDLFAGIIKDAILSAEVQAGIQVSTTGSATAQTGTTTQNGTII